MCFAFINQAEQKWRNNWKAQVRNVRNSVLIGLNTRYFTFDTCYFYDDNTEISLSCFSCNWCWGSHLWFDLPSLQWTYMVSCSSHFKLFCLPFHFSAACKVSFVVLLHWCGLSLLLPFKVFLPSVDWITQVQCNLSGSNYCITACRPAYIKTKPPCLNER